MQGRVLIHPALARQRFVEIAQLSERDVDLVEASLVIAVEDQPSLDIAPYLGQVNAWSDAVRQRLEGSRDVERTVDAINRLLFESTVPSRFKSNRQIFRAPPTLLLLLSATNKY